MAKQLFSSVLVVGGSGAVGHLFVKTLRESFPDLQISVLDLIEASESVRDVRYEKGIEQFILESKRFDLVILALPEMVALKFIQSIDPVLESETLVVDTLSVKSNISAKVKSLSLDVEYLSINPMFAPSIGFLNQTVLAVPIKTGSRTMEFLSLLGTWGTTIRTLTAEEHDLATAQLQSLTHATIMAFGLALAKGGYDINQLLSIASPPHKVMLSLIARILGGSPDVYRDIQLNNPYAPEVRKGLADSIQEIETLVTQGSESDFSELFDTFRTLLATQQDALAEQCKNIFKSLS